jgi:cytochrome c oxidase subunit 2
MTVAPASLLMALGPQDAFDPAGAQAARIEHLGWFLLVTGVVVYAVVMAIAAAAVVRSRRARRLRGAAPEAGGGPHLEPDPTSQRRLGRAVAVGVGLTAIVLVGVTVFSYTTGRAIARRPDVDMVTIKVTGHQWWWGVEYQTPVSSRSLRTANEIHVPVGRPVQVQLTSADVIHSFWAPSLNGKRDAIPGQTSTQWFVVDEPGTWRGQCAEFCGYQHAHMAFTVVAEPAEQFDAWYEAGLRPAAAPAAPAQQRGHDVFLTSSCVLCHTVSGTPAGGRVGPDLTHVASRGTIAAGTLENNKGNLMGWVSDPSAIKPGTRMPPNPMSPDDLEALVAYLQSLK